MKFIERLKTLLGREVRINGSKGGSTFAFVGAVEQSGDEFVLRRERKEINPRQIGHDPEQGPIMYADVVPESMIYLDSIEDDHVIGIEVMEESEEEARRRLQEPESMIEKPRIGLFTPKG